MVTVMRMVHCLKVSWNKNTYFYSTNFHRNKVRGIKVLLRIIQWFFFRNIQLHFLMPELSRVGVPRLFHLVGTRSQRISDSKSY